MGSIVVTKTLSVKKYTVIEYESFNRQFITSPYNNSNKSTLTKTKVRVPLFNYSPNIAEHKVNPQGNKQIDHSTHT